MPGGGEDTMLSARLSSLAAHLREYEYDGCVLEPVAVQAMAAILSQAALDAGALERLTVPREARLDAASLPEGVTPLWPEPPA